MAEYDDTKTQTISELILDGGTNTNVELPPTLVLLSGPDKQVGQQWVLRTAKAIIGRVTNAEISVDHGGLSKAHAQLNVKDGQVTITDLGSTNKTQLNAEILEPHKPYPLKNNDQIRAGKVIFKFLQRGILSETKEKARMQSELESARVIQASIFPTENESRYGYVQIGGRYRTATECGGDWWWHWSSGQKAFAIIADATGHGAAAAMLTSAARSAVATLEEDPNTTVEKLFQTMTVAIHRCSDGVLNMSAFLVEVDLSQRRLRYINASHPYPVWLPRDLSPATEWRRLKMISDGKSASLGLPNRAFKVGSCEVPVESRLVLLTDGITERMKSDGQPMMEREFYSSLIRTQCENPVNQAEFLDALLRDSDQMARAELQDDITVVALDFL